jgi:RimJ/RimL family protein N-acetyltransferase
MIVRPATPDDLPWLHAQARAFSDFFGTARPLYGDPAHVDARLRALIAEHVVLVAERPGTGLVGLIAGMLAPHFMNPAIITLGELLWWVPPEHRGGRVALRLLDAFVDIGREQAHWIAFTLEAKSPIEGRVLERRGFRLNERNYLMEVQ